jgi:hypothetical protein
MITSITLPGRSTSTAMKSDDMCGNTQEAETMAIHPETLLEQAG